MELVANVVKVAPTDETVSNHSPLDPGDKRGFTDY